MQLKPVQEGGTTIHSVNVFPTGGFDQPLTSNLGGLVTFSHGLILS